VWPNSCYTLKFGRIQLPVFFPALLFFPPILGPGSNSVSRVPPPFYPPFFFNCLPTHSFLVFAPSVSQSVEVGRFLFFNYPPPSPHVVRSAPSCVF